MERRQVDEKVSPDKFIPLGQRFYQDGTHWCSLQHSTQSMACFSFIDIKVFIIHLHSKGWWVYFFFVFFSQNMPPKQSQIKRDKKMGKNKCYWVKFMKYLSFQK